MIAVLQDLDPRRRRAPWILAEIMGRPDEPGDDEQGEI